jgi:bacterioferritin-associated ferredoxin
VIVCHCRAVNHREIEAAIADGARSITEVTQACGAGGDCGGCHPTIADHVADSLEILAEVFAPIRTGVRVAAA